MTVSEIERTELVNHLVATIGKEPTETLMKCILPDGREQLATNSDLAGLRLATNSDLAGLQFATKDDLKVLESSLRGEMAGLRGYVDSALAKQTRLYIATMSGFMLTIWATLLVQIVA